MANTRELRRRIKSVKSTAQITKAMQMVAATKMRRAQNQALAGRPYIQNLGQALIKLLPKINTMTHPFLSGNTSKKAGVVLLSTDKGLVGALNTNLARIILSSDLLSDTIYYTLGRRGRAFIVRTGKDLKADFENPDVVSFKSAKQLSRMLIDAFTEGEIGEAFIVYPNFISTLRQQAKIIKLLPISLDEILKTLEFLELEKKNETQTTTEFLFEPDPDVLLDFILLHHLETRIYQALLETKACEHSARMMAMQNATDNALELVDDLKLTYNQTRQNAITTELLEITTAQGVML